MNKYEAQEIFDGAILSDAGVYVQVGNNPYFSIGLSGEVDHFDWLYHIKEALVTLDFDVTNTYPKRYNSVSHDKPYVQQLLRSSNNEMLWSHRNRWYPNG